MVDPITSSNSEDPLSLFGAETQSSAPTPETATSAPASVFDRVPAAAAAVGTIIAAPRAVKPTPQASRSEPEALNIAPVPEPAAQSGYPAVEDVGPPRPRDVVSFHQICTVKPLGFVEGVALIQATCEALNAPGAAGGVPELDGLFLAEDGTILLHGPATADPPAKQLARLLHQMVQADMMPPAGRLFVGRWIDGEASGLRDFVSELSYFARPNGQELLVGVYRRCEGAPTTNLLAVERRRHERPKEERKAKETTVETVPRRDAMVWVRAHKRAITAAVALILGAVSATAVGTLLWAPGTVEASKETAPATDPAALETATGTQGDAGDIALPDPRAKRPNGATRSNALRSSGSPAVLASKTGLPVVNQSPGIESGALSREQAADAGPPLTARTPPDLRIYSTTDSGVEPPRLRSAEIPELLIAGFERRLNRIELVISESGEVQQARMIGPPQRMPDVMLLSRAKELHFDPATRNGVPVRYRLIISWNVTP
jgi:hypothetical protein